jgi:hypothetical protein
MNASTNIRAFRYVNYRDIPDYLALGWTVEEPPIFDRVSWYGVTMTWTCDCPIRDLRREAA